MLACPAPDRRILIDDYTRFWLSDRFIYSLCPSNPAARELAVALCRDVSDRYAVTGLSIETPGFLPSIHGYHHEFNLVKPNRWLDNQLGLCFCAHCRAGAHAAQECGAVGLSAFVIGHGVTNHQYSFWIECMVGQDFRDQCFLELGRTAYLLKIR